MNPTSTGLTQIILHIVIDGGTYYKRVRTDKAILYVFILRYTNNNPSRNMFHSLK